MVCKKCGAESPQEAIFCSCCGYRLDEKKACPSCKKMNKKETIYCIYCGTRMDGKTVCKNCNTAHEGRFCPNCGREENVVKAETASANAATSKQIQNNKALKTEQSGSTTGFTKAMALTAEISLMIGFLIALIFTFLIGFTGKGSLVDSTIPSEFNIYYYFGKVYDDFGDIAQIYSELKAMAYILPVLGMIISMCVILFAILSAVRVIRDYLSLLDWRIESAKQKAIDGIAGYLFGVAALLSLNRLSMKMTGGVDVAIGVNTITKIGVILTLVCLGSYFVAKQISVWKKPTQRKAIVWVCSLVSIVMLIVTFVLMAMAGVKMDISVEGIKIAVKSAYGYFPVLLAAIDSDLLMKIEGVVSFGLINQVMIVFFLLFLSFTIIEKIKLSVGEGEFELGTSIVLAVAAFFIMIFSILQSGQAMISFEWLYESSIEENIKFNNIDAILIFVFSILNLISSIVCWYINKYSLRETEE